MKTSENIFILSYYCLLGNHVSNIGMYLHKWNAKSARPPHASLQKRPYRSQVFGVICF